MALFESGNPTLTEKMFNKGLELDAARQGIMTVRGTINKFGFMLVLLIASAAFNWHLFQEGKPATTQTLMMVGVFGGLIMAIAIMFKPGWAKYVATPTNTSNGQYGGQFWLNAGGRFPDAPKDLYFASGFQGQMVAIFPSHDLVIVRMGLKEDPEFDFNGLLGGIVRSIKK